MPRLFARLMHRVWREQRGVAYLEFALALPFMLLLFGGSIDLTRMVLLHQKVDKAVFSVGDLITQLESNRVCNDIRRLEIQVVRDMIKPFDWDRGQFRFTVTSVIGARRNPGGPLRDLMEWRYNVGQGNSFSRIGNYSSPYQNTANLPNSIGGLGQDERVIVTEMQYLYEPLLPALSSITRQTFNKQSYFRSRLSTGNEGRGSGNLGRC